MFHTDQQRWDSTGVHGNPLGLTPNFDRAAMEGTHLFNSFTCQPVCAPSRASLQTGLYATSTGVFRNGIPLRRDLPTLARWFRGAGYRTAYIGKWHLASHPGAPRGPVAEADRAGYEEWLAADALEHTSEEYRTVLYDADGKPVRLPGYRVDALADAAIRFIDRQTSSRRSRSSCSSPSSSRTSRTTATTTRRPTGTPSATRDGGCPRTSRPSADPPTSTSAGTAAW